MNAKPSISIIIPVYNEEESLPAFFDEIAPAMAGVDCAWYEIIFVDDGSGDTSLEICKGFYERDPDHVRLVRLRRNFGQTAAMAAGFDAAKGDLIIPMDGDGQNDPADISRLVAKAQEGYDVVSGWRKDRKDKFITRRIPSIVANALISRSTAVHLHDYGCTLKVYRREVVDEMHLYGEMHRFLPALAYWAGARVAEVEVNHRPRIAGESKYGMGRIQRVVLDLITIKFLLTYSTKPMQVFGKYGIYTFGAGVVMGIVAVVLKYLPPFYRDITENPWMYASIFFMLSGLQLIGMGLLGEINVRTYYESQNKRIYSVLEQWPPRDGA